MSSPTQSTLDLPENPEEWNRKGLLAYLRAKQEVLELDDDEIDIFRKNEVTGSDFLSLTQDDLQAVPFNLAFGPARRIQKLISLLRKPQKPPAIGPSKRPSSFDALDAERGSYRPSKKAKGNWVRRGSLIYDPDQFKAFPKHDKADFMAIRGNPQLAYFDRTKYILTIEETKANALLLLRPPRFGKSLIVNMLEYFHGIQYQGDYKMLFEGLDIDRDVDAQNIHPNQWLVLKFNFSAVERSPDPMIARSSLSKHIINRIKHYYKSYHKYLGYNSLGDLIKVHLDEDPISSIDECVRLTCDSIIDANTSGHGEYPLHGARGIYIMIDEYDAFTNEYINTKLSDNHDAKGENEGNPVVQAHEALFKAFWSSLKSSISEARKGGEIKIYITGVLPVSLVDHTSGFNIQTNVSFDKAFSGFCGLTGEEIQEALQIIFKEKNMAETVKHHLERARHYYNGYHFCDTVEVPTVFHVNTCLEYLQSLIDKTRFSLGNPSNSEVPEAVLQLLSKSEVLNVVLQRILNERFDDSTSIVFHAQEVRKDFHIRDLVNCNNNEAVWNTLMLYLGGFTFDPKDPVNRMRIPNSVAANRFVYSILRRFNGEVDSFKAAFQTCMETGDVLGPVKHLQRLMPQLDAHEKDFGLNEEVHRNRFYHLATLYPNLCAPRAEVRVNNALGRIDLTIGPPYQPKTIITEWKALQMDYLDIPPSRGSEVLRLRKAKTLSGMDIDRVLDIRFVSHDRYHPPGKSIRDWVEGTAQINGNESPKEQLARYIGGSSADDYKAYLIVVVGSRRILVWEMDVATKTLGEPRIADWVFNQP